MAHEKINPFRKRPHTWRQSLLFFLLPHLLLFFFFSPLLLIFFFFCYLPYSLCTILLFHLFCITNINVFLSLEERSHSRVARNVIYSKTEVRDFKLENIVYDNAIFNFHKFINVPSCVICMQKMKGKINKFPIASFILMKGDMF